MSRLQALRDALRPLGIYKLEKGTLVYAELAAYAAGLDLLEDGLDELEREAFLPTAQGEGISRREEIYGKPKTLLPLRGNAGKCCFTGELSIIETIPGKDFGKGAGGLRTAGSGKGKIWMARPFILTALTFWRIFRARRRSRRRPRSFCPVTWKRSLISGPWIGIGLTAWTRRLTRWMPPK